MEHDLVMIISHVIFAMLVMVVFVMSIYIFLFVISISYYVFMLFLFSIIVYGLYKILFWNIWEDNEDGETRENFFPLVDNKNHKMTRIWVCMTTIPERVSSLYFENCIKNLLASSCVFYKIHKIIILLPLEYKKFGSFHHWKEKISPFLLHHPKIIILHPPDYGPATKVLGLHVLSKNISSTLTKNDLIVIVDDDLMYQENLIDNMVQKWYNIPPMTPSPSSPPSPPSPPPRSNNTNIPQVKRILANIVYENPQQRNRKEIQASGAYLTVFSWFMEDIPSFLRGYQQFGSDCWNVDDTLLSYSYLKYGYDIVESGIPIGNIYLHNEPHPQWFELKNTHREIDTDRCLESLSSSPSPRNHKPKGTPQPLFKL